MRKFRKDGKIGIKTEDLRGGDIQRISKYFQYSDAGIFVSSIHRGLLGHARSIEGSFPLRLPRLNPNTHRPEVEVETTHSELSYFIHDVEQVGSEEFCAQYFNASHLFQTRQEGAH